MPQQGTIKKVVMNKGYGFITGEQGEVFFHCSEVQDAKFESLAVGQAVTFEIGEGPKGPRATAVRPVSG